MDLGLKNKTALVTGASRGLGYAAALAPIDLKARGGGWSMVFA
jgi:NAD(P)-dependent dehydrogenase (short-subunit alcohol dehydrogenase family)